MSRKHDGRYVDFEFENLTGDAVKCRMLIPTWKVNQEVLALGSDPSAVFGMLQILDCSFERAGQVLEHDDLGIDEIAGALVYYQGMMESVSAKPPKAVSPLVGGNYL